MGLKTLKIFIFLLSLITIIPGFASDMEDANRDYLYGVLPCGLTYYIRHTPNPVNFYLVERAGSLNEEDSQSGLAHFLEHLAFKGTRHFPERTLIDYLQSKGVSFGADLNAVTSFDKTTFRIENVPADPNLIDTCLLILKDWSGDLLLENEKIDAERAVIEQEWRTTGSLQKRIREKLSSQLLPPHHPYAYKTPIGNMDVVRNFKYQELKDFYKKWYRPELQAVIVEGTIDPEVILKKIKMLWSDSGAASEVPEFVAPTVPFSPEPIAAIASDRDIRGNSIDIVFFSPENIKYSSKETFEKRNLAQSMIASMLAARLREKSHENNPPFRSPGVYYDTYTVAQNTPALTVGASFPGEDPTEAINAIGYELHRVATLGFTEEELQQQKNELVGRLEFFESGNATQNNLSSQFIDNFTKGTPIVTLADRVCILKDFIETLNLSEINRSAAEDLHPEGDNTAIILRVNSDMDSPSTMELVSAYKNALDQEVEEYKWKPAEIFTAELMEATPAKGKVVEEQEIGIPGVKKWRLSNGASVYLWPSDSSGFINISAVSRGGYSKIPADNFVEYTVMNTVMDMSGLGGYPAQTIKKIIAPKQLTYSAKVDALTESFSGRASMQDIEDLLQLMYLRFTTFPKDSLMFENWRNNFKANLVANEKSPYSAVMDSISMLLNSQNPRMGRMNAVMMDSLDYDKVIRLYAERFGNASDFDFIFTGDINEEKIKDLAETYIASLPSSGNKKREKFDAGTFSTPAEYKGLFQVEMATGIPKTTVMQTRNTEDTYSLKNRLIFRIMQDLLTVALQKEIRDNLGGAYSIHVEGDISRVPENLLSLYINFDTNPDKAERMVEAIDATIRNFANSTPDVAMIEGIKRNISDEYQRFAAGAEFKMNVLKDYLLYDTLEALEYDNILGEITAEDIMNTAGKVADAPTVVTILLEGK